MANINSISTHKGYYKGRSRTEHDFIHNYIQLDLYSGSGLLLVVLSDNFRPPITIQNERKKQTFETYVFTFDIVPLVLEETCFVGHTFKYKWKTKKKAQSRKCNAEMRKGNTCKGPSNKRI